MIGLPPMQKKKEIVCLMVYLGCNATISIVTPRLFIFNTKAVFISLTTDYYEQHKEDNYLIFIFTIITFSDLENTTYWYYKIVHLWWLVRQVSGQIYHTVHWTFSDVLKYPRPCLMVLWVYVEVNISHSLYNQQLFCPVQRTRFYKESICIEETFDSNKTLFLKFLRYLSDELHCFF